MATVKVREKYRGLSRQQLLDKAYELGVKCDQNSQSCSQCTVATLHELLGFDDVIVKVASSSCGGQAGQAVGTCGALIGGTIVLDYFFGRPVEDISYTDIVKPPWEAMEVAKVLYDRYIREYGTIICPHIQAQLFGRHFYFPDPEDMEKFEKAGGHEDKCPHVVGNAARWVMEILLDKGGIEL